MLKAMNELDEVWAEKLSKATAKARAAGRADVAEYLSLKASNDMLRQTSANWLFESLTEIANRANDNGLRIIVETENPHRFSFRNAQMVGSLLSFRHGVRCLSVEAGWTRTPADGFMRGGALAAARITHFGISKHNAELVLVLEKDTPNWFSVDKDGRREPFDSRNLNHHFKIFLDTI